MEDFTREIIITIIAVTMVSLWVYNLYTVLARKKNKVLEAFSLIEIQLRKRYDIIANILTIVQTIMEQEKTLIDEITKLRTQAIHVTSDFDNINQKIILDKVISQKMGQLIVAIEQYPQLKSDQEITISLRTYNEIEEHLASARKLYNSAAYDLKNAVESFPTSMIANVNGIRAVDFFQIKEK